MTRHRGSTNARVIKFKSLTLFFGLLVPENFTQGGQTSGGVITICDDHNVCTNDTTTPNDDCIFTNNTDPCDDHNICTTGDRCSNGACSGTTINCNDLNECTNDSCNSLGECVHANNSLSCYDGIFCNGNDRCSGGICALHSGTPCLPNIPCHEATHSCGPASVISFKAVKINNLPITPGTCNLALAPPRCSAGNVNKVCASNVECHVGISNLVPNKCAGGPNFNSGCSTNADCPGSTCVLLVAGDTIEVEFSVSRWTFDLPAGIRLFQLQVYGESFVSSDNGTAKPLGWCGPVEKIPCTAPATCPPEYPICIAGSTAGCRCSPHNPDLGAFITMSRSDFLLFGLDGPLSEAITSNINFTYFGLAENPSQAVRDTGVPRYLGSLILKLSANACGTFTIGFVPEITSTFIADPALKPRVALPTMQPLVFTVSDCSRQLLSCSPTHCNIDARIAHDRLDQSTRKNAFQMVMTFNKSTTSPDLTAADFEVTVLPFNPEDIIPTITLFTPNPDDPRITTVGFLPRIQQSRWTCIRHKESNKRCCMGSLPANAEDVTIGRYTSEPADVFEILDNLKGIVSPALPIERCDTDRSARCSGADLLMVVDLLTGADAFEPVWHPVLGGDRLPALVPACPTMNLPP